MTKRAWMLALAASLVFPIQVQAETKACAQPKAGGYVVMERGVVGTEPTARLIQERWMPNGRIEGIVFERTLGVGCGVGVLLALPAVVLALLFLLWSPALNLLSRSEHKQWQRCIAEQGQGLKRLLPGHLERQCGAEPPRFFWQADQS